MNKRRSIVAIVLAILGAGALTLSLSINPSNVSVEMYQNTENIESNSVSGLNSAHIGGNVTINNHYHVR